MLLFNSILLSKSSVSQSLSPSLFFFLPTRVVDLGVMTPCDKILQTAIEEKAGNFVCVCVFEDMYRYVYRPGHLSLHVLTCTSTLLG